MDSNPYALKLCKGRSSSTKLINFINTNIVVMSNKLFWKYVFFKKIKS